MKGKAGPLGLLVLTGALFALLLGASGARAEFGITKWEALTCKENVDTPANFGEKVIGFPPAPSPLQCTGATPEKWFTQAAGHPPFGITDFMLNTFSAPKFANFPEGFVKDIVVDTPEGLDVNPEASAAKCTVEELKATPLPTCSPLSLVGAAYLTVAGAAPPCESPPYPVEACPVARVKLPVYNLVPFQGVPSMVGFPTSAPGEPTIIVGDLDPKDQHVRFTISNIHPPDGTEAHPPIIGSRLVFEGNKGTPFGDGTYLTMPSNCAGGQTSLLHVDSWEGKEDNASYTTAVGASECDTAPFNVQLAASSAGSTDSPEPATVDVRMPDQLAPNQRANSHLLTAKITLPEGAGLNPSLANGLTPCTDAQFKKGTDEPVECPASSEIGSIEVESRALDQKLGGDVYVAQPLSQEASSGNQFRVFLHAFNERYGVNVRLVGHAFPNLTTGQLTLVVPENPQAPFNSFKVNVNGGPRGALTSPPTCGPNTATAKFTPWARPTEEVPSQSQFTLTTQPGGAPCAKTLAERPFAPGFSAASANTKAGSYQPFKIVIARNDGEQELKVVNLTLPKGVTGKLAGIPYCSDSAIAAAAASSGAAQQTSYSCPSESQIGTSTTTVGTGTDPLKMAGKAFLAGPYKGAPLSVVVITPGVAGPYDVGTVVVRAAVKVNPMTAQVEPASDQIPDVFGGVKLDIRSIDVDVNRSQFMLNPTNCAAHSTAGVINGGGGDPSNSAAFSSHSVSDPYAVSECNTLKFKPKLHTRLYGPTKRAKNPRIRAILEAREGDANVSRTALTLPHSIFLDQSHIKTVCTRPQLASASCPKNAVYGHAEAKTPLLDKKLKGPVYLVSSNHKLPDLVADLRGQVNIQLHGVISSKRGGIKTVFNEVPDVPVKKFILNMSGGKKSLLVNSRNLCQKKQTSVMNLKGQNGKKVKNNRLRLRISACSKH